MAVACGGLGESPHGFDPSQDYEPRPTPSLGLTIKGGFVERFQAGPEMHIGPGPGRRCYVIARDGDGYVEGRREIGRETVRSALLIGLRAVCRKHRLSRSGERGRQGAPARVRVAARLSRVNGRVRSTTSSSHVGVFDRGYLTQVPRRRARILASGALRELRSRWPLRVKRTGAGTDTSVACSRKLTVDPSGSRAPL
jgi:hypothetical protein